MSRSRGNDAVAIASGSTRCAPGSVTVLCSYGYFKRTSMMTGCDKVSALSSLAFSSSREMRGTDMRKTFYRRGGGEPEENRGAGVAVASRGGRSVSVLSRRRERRAVRAHVMFMWHGRRLFVQVPPLRTPATCRATQEDCARLAADAVVMADKVAAEPMPHDRSPHPLSGVSVSA